MFQLDRHIEILLLDNDCVIVPGLGGFIAHHVSAHYDEETKTFIPPLRTLGFNRQLQINDSLLAQSYIEAYDISYPEAVRHIEDDVNELQQRLKNDGSYEFNDLGILRYNTEDKLTFEPCEAGILTPQLYGLNLIDINPLISTESKPKAEHKQPKMPMSVSLNEIDNTAENVEEEEEKPKTITIRISTIKYAVATAAAVIFIVCFALPFTLGDQAGLIKSGIDTSALTNLIENKTTENTEAKQQQKTEATPSAAPDDSTQKPEQPAENQDVNATTGATNKETEAKSGATKKETEAKSGATKNVADAKSGATITTGTKADTPKTKVETSKPHYSLVLASRVSRKNAQDYIKRLKKQGITAQIVMRSNGCQVITGNYKSQSEAQKALRSYRSGCDIFADSWVTNVK